MSASVLVIQHAAPETPGILGDVLRGRRIPIEVVHTHEGAAVPGSVAGRRGLVVMGGPMGVYEQSIHPHLGDEIRLIRAALDAEIPVFGVCLGSQLLAAALGARVAPATREIGWFPVELTGAAAGDSLWNGIETPFTPFHWHGDAFDLPPGAVHLARSERTPLQAFSFGGRAYGTLFHLEVQEPMVRAMAAAFDGELASSGVDRDVMIAGAGVAVRALRRTADTVFGRWADLL
jgi:GMP synthase (glutamine-hydrolysing)